MNSWQITLGKFTRAVTATALLTAAPVALAQMRTIPQDAVRGTMSPSSGMNVVLDGREVALGAGAVIRNQNNLIIVASALARSSTVRYTRDAQGRIERVWVLSDAEKRQR